MSKPLASVKVLDLSRLLPGPLCSLHLADFGADVIKVEDPGAGDYARTLGASKNGANPMFEMINRNKRSIVLDLKNADDREKFLKLVEQSDVVLETFRPGVMDKLGVGFDELQKRNPKIILCSISGYGQNGPWVQQAGHDINYIATGGVLHLMGRKDDGTPSVPNFQIGDVLGGSMTATMGITMALYDAQRTGKGRQVDVSMTDAAMAHGVIGLGGAEVAGQAMRPDQDMLGGSIACYDTYPCKDGAIAVGALEPKFWMAFCQAVGKPDWAARGHDPKDATIKQEVSDLLMTKTRAEWGPIFEAADCCVTPVLDTYEALAHPQNIARGMSVEIDHPDAGKMHQFGTPLKFSDCEFSVDRLAPKQGEHTEEVLAEFGL